MNKNRIHLIFWFMTIVLTGITTGFYLSHSLILGPWFTWFVTNQEKLPLLYQTYSEFRATHVPFIYQLICGLQLLVFIIFTIISVLKRNKFFIAIIALFSSISVGIIHFATGFGKLEIEVLSGINRDKMALVRYANMNVPLHVIYFILMFISFMLLIIYFVKLKTTN